MNLARQQCYNSLTDEGGSALGLPVLGPGERLEAAEELVIAWLRNGGVHNPPSAHGRWIEAFLAGGRVALEHAIRGEDWLYLRVEPPVGVAPKTLLVSALLPALSRHVEEGSLRMFWYLLKQDIANHIRLRMFGDVERQRTLVLPDLIRSLGQWGEAPVKQPLELTYEPETSLFGGAWCLERIHRLFCSDSRFILEWSALVANELRGITDHQISLILQQYLLESAGLDSFEVWDVWQKVARLREGDAQVLESVWHRMKNQTELLLRVSPVSLAQGLGSSARGILERHAADLETLGRELSAGQRTGLLERGLRQVLATVICFHWNRMGFTGEEQSALAHVAARATTPLE